MKAITIAGTGSFTGYSYTVYLSDIYLAASAKSDKYHVILKCDKDMAIEVTASEFSRIQQVMFGE